MSQALATTDGHSIDSVIRKDLDDFVTFTVGNQLFGIPVLKVQDILTPDKIASVPLAPPEVKGSINLRGRIVTVIDVRVRLNMSPRETPNSVAVADEDAGESAGESAGEGADEGVVVEVSAEVAPAAANMAVNRVGTSQMGVTVEDKNELYTLLVDGIGDVIGLSKEQFDGNPNTLDPAWREFSSGVYQLENQLMVVLDVERLLDIRYKKTD